jgi:hypothetical protein
VGNNTASQHYSAQVERYFRRPVLPMVGDIRGEAGSVRQGARICFAAYVRDNCLRNVAFRALACPHIIAGCNRIAERLEGAEVNALLAVAMEDIQIEFDIPIEKAGKLLIIQDALQACFADLQANIAPI